MTASPALAIRIATFAFTAVPVVALPVRAGPAADHHAAQSGWQMSGGGSFEVRVIPETEPTGRKVGSAVLEKRYSGHLVGKATGQMLTFSTDRQGSAAYVAIEHVSGNLGSHEGSFALVHRGVMHGRSQQLSITIVPDSGTEGLVGLSGKMELRIDEGKHFYTISYSLLEQ